MGQEERGVIDEFPGGAGVDEGPGIILGPERDIIYGGITFAYLPILENVGLLWGRSGRPKKKGATESP